MSDGISRVKIKPERSKFQIDCFLYEPTSETKPKGIIFSIGGSGLSRAGFGGPSILAKLAQKNGFLAVEWNKRGLTTNDSVDDLSIDLEIYNTSTIDNIIDDSKNVVAHFQSLFPSLETFMIGGSEGSCVATILAEQSALNIKAICIFGAVIAPFIEMIEYQIRQPLENVIQEYFKKNDMKNNGKLTALDLKSLSELDDDFTPVVQKILQEAHSAEFTFSREEFLSLLIDYYLLEMPNRNEYWYNTSRVPIGFFEEMISLPSLFQRASQISVSTLVMHGLEDASSPVIHVRQLERQCKMMGLNNFTFRYYADAGHAPNQAMLNDALNFFNEKCS